MKEITVEQVSAGRASANRRGIIAIVASQAAFVFGDAFAKLASAHLPTGELIVIRGLFATVLVFATISAAGQLGAVKLVFRKIVLARAAVEAIIIAAFLSGLPFLPLGNIVAITQAAPLITTLLLVAVYKEQVGWRRWSAIGAGFFGVMLVVKPDAHGLNSAAALILLSAFLIAVRDLITRKVPPIVPSMIITLATTEVAILAGASLGITEVWVVPTGVDYLYLGGAAVATTIGNFFVVQAFRGTDVAVVSPFRYCIVIFALILGFLIWREVPDALSILGTLIIVASGVFMMYREKIRGGRQVSPNADIEA